jgi:serine/threonine protein kinase
MYENQEEINFVFQTLISYVNQLSEYNVYHSDIKPPNIILTKERNSPEYNIKLIDFGGSSCEYSKVSSYTLQYWNSDFKEFPSKEERIKAEYYTVARTILRVNLNFIYKQK